MNYTIRYVWTNNISDSLIISKNKSKLHIIPSYKMSKIGIICFI